MVVLSGQPLGYDTRSVSDLEAAEKPVAGYPKEGELRFAYPNGF